MSLLIFCCFMCFLLLTKSTIATSNMKVDHNCSMNNLVILGGIGGVLDLSSREGKEQKIGMELAVQDFYSLTCYNLPLHLKDLRQNSGHTASDGKLKHAHQNFSCSRLVHMR